MQTLSYGYKKPQSPDTGSVVFPALEADIQQLNDHDHNGTNSAKLTSASFTNVTQTILSGGWVAQGGGTYRQVVTIMVGYAYDTSTFSFRDPDGTYINPSVVKIDNTQFYVYTNDNTLDMKIIYGV